VQEQRINSTPPTSRALELLQRLVLLERGELRAMLLSAAYFFFVLFSYYMLRPVRETFGIQRGWENLPWLMTGTLAVMLVVNPLYAWLVSRHPRRRFIPYAYRFFALNMLSFYAAFRFVPDQHRDWLGYAFYIWLSVFNLFVVSIFWAFMADLWSRAQGIRLFGAIGVGGTIGAILGAAITGGLAEGITIGETMVQVSPPTMMLLAIIPLECAVQCVRRLMPFARAARPINACLSCQQSMQGVPTTNDVRRCPACGHMNPIADANEPGPGAWKGIARIARSPYLLLICAYMLLFTTTSTYLYLEQGRIIEITFPDVQQRTAAFATIDLWVNVLTLVTQLFLTGRLIRLVGVGAALSIVPALTVIGFVGLWAMPGYGMLVVFQTIRRSMHYAIDRPARETLYTVIDQDARYKSKSFIDTFIYRAGDMLGAWTGKLFSVATFAMAWIAVPMAVLWMTAAIMLGRQQSIEARNAERTKP